MIIKEPKNKEGLEELFALGRKRLTPEVVAEMLKLVERNPDLRGVYALCLWGYSREKTKENEKIAKKGEALYAKLKKQWT